MAEACEAVGLAGAPLGFSKLTKRQREFTLEFLRTGNSTASARSAGYSNPTSDGAKVQNHPEVRAILVQAGVKVAKNADKLIERASIRSRSLHEMFEAELAKGEAADRKELRRCARAAREADMLLGSLLGKVQGVNISGTISHKHSAEMPVTVPETALAGLAQMRREVQMEKAGDRN